MKSIKYLLISLLALCGANEVYACWGPLVYPPEDTICIGLKIANQNHL